MFALEQGSFLVAGLLVWLSPRPLYAHAQAAGAWVPLSDQQLGGIVMLVAGGVVYLLGGLALMARLLLASGEERRTA